MRNFVFHNPTKIIFGYNQIIYLREELPQDARVLVTYGGGSVKANGVLSQVREALEGRTSFEFFGIQANPDYGTLLEAIELARQERIDYLVAVGGGSVIDGTKFIAAALRYDGEPWDIVAKPAVSPTDAVPIGCVLTLPATGSEMNGNAVVSRAETGDKLDFKSPHVLPRFAILDPTNSYTLPPRQIANGVVDAFVHVIEQYLTFPVGAKVQDRFAEGLLLTLIEEGPQALAEPQNYLVRANLMWAASLALNGLIGAGVPQDWSTHMIGHQLTARHGLDHAQTLAVVLPSILQMTRITKKAKLLQYAERVWGLRDGSEEQRINAAIAATRDFFERMQVPTRLSSYGLDGSSIPAIIDKLGEHGMIALGENGMITLEVSRQVLKSAV
jgi:NADP-dependent alcohol dehydrogenase